MTMGKKNMGLISFSISLFLREIKLEFWQMELYFEIELVDGHSTQNLDSGIFYNERFDFELDSI